MAAPEAPLNYVGVARKSAAFRLMKQMVYFYIHLIYLFKALIFLISFIICNGFGILFRDGKKVKGLGKRNKGLKDMLGFRINKILLVCFGYLFLGF